jgi:hypothetical protein
MSFVWKWSWEIVLVLIVLSVGIATYSFAQNRQLAYAPCLAKVMTRARIRRRCATSPSRCPRRRTARSPKTSREANHITDMLVGDKTLFTRLPKLLADAGMDCENNKSVSFATANERAADRQLCETRRRSTPLPLKGAYRVTRQPAVHGARPTSR